MKKRFSVRWKSSKQPRKQRKYLKNLPLHLRGGVLNVHLSSQLRQKYGKRSLRIIKGDRARILRGSFKGREAVVTKVDTRNYKVYLQGIERKKVDGSVKPLPLNASNLMITDLKLDDRLRVMRLSSKKKLDKRLNNTKEINTKEPNTPNMVATKNGNEKTKQSKVAT